MNESKISYYLKESILLALGILLIMMTFFYFAPLGFNPSDEGYYLAVAKRILSGQLPHRDFISIMPVGSSILQIPILLLSESDLFRFSRFWFITEIFIISYIWIKTLFLFINPVKNKVLEFLLVMMTFQLSIHYFPFMPWPTVDGILCTSIGFYLIQKNIEAKYWGYFFLGVAALCKQNFLAMIPIVVLIEGDFRKLSIWLTSLSAIFLYLLVIFFFGGGGAFIDQMSAHKGLLFNRGFVNFLENPYLYLGFFIGSSYWVIEELKETKFRLIPLMLFLIGFVFSLISLVSDTYVMKASYYIFGLIIGIGVVEIHNSKRDIQLLKYLFFIASLSWASAISLGYQSPALLSGICMTSAFVILISKLNFKMIKLGSILICLSLATIISWSNARLNNIYYDLPEKFLSEKLDGELPGAENIVTNQRTFAFLKEAQQIIDDYKDREFAIIPDYAAYWAGSDKMNPLSADWLIATEVPTFKAEEKIRNDLISLTQRNGIVLVQNTLVWYLRYTKKEMDDSYPLVNFVEDNLKLLEEREFFKVYE